MAKCPYEILGVDKSATPEEISRAYRKMAKVHHPDKNGGDSTQFKLIASAYEVLGDFDRRQHYDETGSTEPIRSQAFEILASMLNSVLHEFVSNGRDFEKADLVKRLADEIKAKKSKLKSVVEKATKQAEKFRKAADRMKVDSGDNLLQAAMLEPAKQLEAESASAIRQIEQLDECDAMLSHYRYEFDKAGGFDSTWPPSVNSGGWASYTFGTKG